MGVPGFATWFSQVCCPNAFLDTKARRAAGWDHVYVDMASILHAVLRQAKNERRFHVLLHRQLNNVLAVTQPRKSVIFALDGPAPLAKMLTQRQRRQVTVRKEVRGKAEGLSSLGLTPGTPFMDFVQESLAHYVCCSLQSHWGHLTFELSDATVMGEGEVKLLGRLMRPSTKVAPGDAHVMVGGDSDLLLMALLEPPVAHLWILPDSHIRASRRVRLKAFSAEALPAAWSAQLQLASLSPQEAARRLSQVKGDLVVLAIMANGNDYLPGVRGITLGGTTCIWRCYLALHSQDAWRDRALLVRGSGGIALDVAFLAALVQAYRQKSAYGVAATDPADTLRPPVDAGAYLQGLQWVVAMYIRGECRNYRYTYEAHGPSTSDLLTFLDSQPGATIPSVAGDITALPLSPAACALALLPPGTGRPHAPAPFQHLMDAGSPIGDLYESCTECEALYEAHGSNLVAYLAAGKEVGALNRAIAEGKGDRASDDVAPLMDALLDSKQTLAATRSRLRETEIARLAHMRSRHPYLPFPVARLEAAVAAVPQGSLSEAERKLLGFGTPSAFWVAGGGRQCDCAGCAASAGGQKCVWRIKPPAGPPGRMRTPDFTKIFFRQPILSDVTSAADANGPGKVEDARNSTHRKAGPLRDPELDLAAAMARGLKPRPNLPVGVTSAGARQAPGSAAFSTRSRGPSSGRRPAAANMGCPASRALHAERALQPRGQLLARAASRLRLCLVRLA